MDDLTIGSTICSWNGEPTIVQSITPQGSKQVYTIEFHDGSKTEACLDHLWSCWYVPKQYNSKTRSVNKRSVSGIKTTGEIMELLQRSSHGNFKFNVSIPVHIPNKTSPDIVLPMDPYILGCLIGDGCITQGTPRLTTYDSHVVEQCSSLLQSGYALSKVGGTVGDYFIAEYPKTTKDNHYTNIIRDMGLYGCTSTTKFIPTDYLHGSYNQRLRLVQGLMDTDGTVDPKGLCSFTTTSPTLAQQFQRLMWSLGALCSVHKRAPSYKDNSGEAVECAPAYTLHINVPDKTTLFTLPRKLEKIKPTNPASMRRRVVSVTLSSVQETQCISIDHPSKLYVTDDYVVTHNSTTAAGLFHNLKCKQFEVELVTEYAKDMVWEKRHNIMDDQLYIFAKQYRRISRLIGQVDFIITDSPLLLSCAYIRDGYYENLKPLVFEVFTKFTNLNFVIKRSPSADFNQNGRMQDLTESQAIDDTIIQLLTSTNSPFQYIPDRDPTAIDVISAVCSQNKTR